MFKLKKSVGLFAKIGETSSGVRNNLKDRLTKFESKVQGTMVENWLRYWKGVCRDYKDVAVDVAKEIRENPSKALLLASTFGLVTYCGRHNPTPTQFRDAFIKSANDVALVHHALVRDETKEHLKYVESAHNNELLRYTSLGLFTIVWVDNFSRKCSKFETQCSYLQLGYSEILSRVVDIGFLDTWWVLAKKMHDYDVNF